MSQTPAGGYPDAHDPHLLRWWDGVESPIVV